MQEGTTNLYSNITRKFVACNFTFLKMLKLMKSLQEDVKLGTLSMNQLHLEGLGIKLENHLLIQMFGELALRWPH